MLLEGWLCGFVALWCGEVPGLCALWCPRVSARSGLWFAAGFLRGVVVVFAVGPRGIRCRVLAGVVRRFFAALSTLRWSDSAAGAPLPFCGWFVDRKCVSG